MSKLTYWMVFIDTDDTAVASLYTGNGSGAFVEQSNYERAVSLYIFSKTYQETNGNWGWKPISECMGRIRGRLANAPIVLFDTRTREVYLGFVTDNNLVHMPDHSFESLVGFMDRLEFNSQDSMKAVIKALMSGDPDRFKKKL